VLLVAGWAIVRLVPRRPEWLPQLPVLALGVLSAMWCIERGLAALV
jgi:hypothetical protein